jgi:hypothetical protein
MKPFKFRASSLATIMTEPKSKSEILSAGAKTELGLIAKELVYGFSRSFSSKYTEKGTLVEPDALALYNSVFFTNHVKNTERRTNDWITGECDIYTGSKVIDLKSSWSLPTFPATAAEGKDTAYEWQIRAYLWLWDCQQGEVAYCLVDTPADLVGWESEELHYVSQIPEILRITRVFYERDESMEDRIKAKVEAANAYLEQLVKQIADEHAG